MAITPQGNLEQDLPESDRLEDFPHPRERAALVGHARAEQILAAAHASRRLHHAWLICGTKGIGKATLAYRFARHLLKHSEPPDAGPAGLYLSPDDPVFRQVAAGAHPDMVTVTRNYDPKTKRIPARLGIDDIRRAKAFLSRTSAAGGFRICVIDTVDEMTDAAANALLKILEEPPDKVVFLGISHVPGRLLPTIRSRCRKLTLNALARDDLNQVVSELSGQADAPDADRIALLSAGSIAKALVLSRSGGLSVYGRMLEVLAGLPNLDLAAAHEFADDIGQKRDRQRFNLFAEFIADWLARLANCAARGTPPPDRLEAEIAARLAAPGTASVWADRWSEITHSLQRANTLNLDARHTVLNIFFRLEDTARNVI